MRGCGIAGLVLLFGLGGQAYAQDLRPLCPDRPGLGTPACIVDKGHAIAELGLVDWTLERDAGERSDTWTLGDLLLRYGVTGTTEVQAGFTSFGTVRLRDPGGTVRRQSGVGDMTLALKQSFAHPDGSGISVAMLPFATLPTGGHAIGAGDWGAGVIVPLSFSLNDKLALAFSPEVDAAVDEDRHGRHLAYGSVVGLNGQFGKFGSAIEFAAMRDNDPEGHATRKLASLSVDWQPRGNLQFDMGAVAGLNAESPDVELYFGIARRF